jgi:Fur family iron response transcriptional regulator
MRNVETNKPALIALDGVVTIPNREPISAGCPRCEIEEILQSAGLRLTRQRLVLGALLFGKGPRHLTAEMLYEEAIQANASLSLATVYNTLNQLTDVGLLRQVRVGGAKAYFDTNVTSHHHFYIESSHVLVDVSHSEIVLRDLQDLPEGYEISRVDIVVRLKKKRH